MGKLLIKLHSCELFPLARDGPVNLRVVILVDNTYTFSTHVRRNMRMAEFNDVFVVGNTHRLAVIEVLVYNMSDSVYLLPGLSQIRNSLDGSKKAGGSVLVGRCFLSIRRLVQNRMKTRDYYLGTVASNEESAIGQMSPQGIAGIVTISLQSDTLGESPAVLRLNDALEMQYIHRLRRFFLSYDKPKLQILDLLVANVRDETERLQPAAETPAITAAAATLPTTTTTTTSHNTSANVNSNQQGVVVVEQPVVVVEDSNTNAAVVAAPAGGGAVSGRRVRVTLGLPELDFTRPGHCETFAELMRRLCEEYGCQEPCDYRVYIEVQGCSMLDTKRLHAAPLFGSDRVYVVLRTDSEGFVTSSRQLDEAVVWREDNSVVLDVTSVELMVVQVIVMRKSAGRSCEIGRCSVSVAPLAMQYDSMRDLFLCKYESITCPMITGVVHLLLRPENYGLVPREQIDLVDSFYGRLSRFFSLYDPSRVCEVDMLVRSRVEELEELMQDLVVEYGREPGTMQLSVILDTLVALREDPCGDLHEKEVHFIVTMGGVKITTRAVRVRRHVDTSVNQCCTFDVVRETDIIRIEVVKAHNHDIVYGCVDFSCLNIQRGVDNACKLYLVGLAGSATAYLSGVLRIRLFSQEIGLDYAVDTALEELFAGRLRRYLQRRLPEYLHRVNVIVATRFDMETYMAKLAARYGEEDPTYGVHFTVIGCRRLKPRFGGTNAYVVVQMGVDAYHTRPVKSKTEPDFFEFCEFAISRLEDEAITVIVMDHTGIGHDEEIGRVVIPLRNHPIGQLHHNFLPLQSPYIAEANEDVGTVGFKFNIIDLHVVDRTRVELQREPTAMTANDGSAMNGMTMRSSTFVVQDDKAATAAAASSTNSTTGVHRANSSSGRIMAAAAAAGVAGASLSEANNNRSASRMRALLSRMRTVRRRLPWRSFGGLGIAGDEAGPTRMLSNTNNAVGGGIATLSRGTSMLGIDGVDRANTTTVYNGTFTNYANDNGLSASNNGGGGGGSSSTMPSANSKALCQPVQERALHPTFNLMDEGILSVEELRSARSLDRHESDDDAFHEQLHYQTQAAAVPDPQPAPSALHESRHGTLQSPGGKWLHVRLLYCRHLLHAEGVLPNPYVLLSTLCETHHSRVEFDSADPEYNEEFVFKVMDPAADALRLTVITDTPYGSKKIGHCVLSLRNVPCNRPYRRQAALVVNSHQANAFQHGVVFLLVHGRNFGVDYLPSLDAENRLRERIRELLLVNAREQLHCLELYVGDLSEKESVLLGATFGKQFIATAASSRRASEVTLQVYLGAVTHLMHNGFLVDGTCTVKLSIKGRRVAKTEAVTGVGGDFAVNQYCELTIVDAYAALLQVNVFVNGKDRAGFCVVSLADLHRGVPQRRAHMLVIDTRDGSPAPTGFVSVTLLSADFGSDAPPPSEQEEAKYVRLQRYYSYYLRDELATVDVQYANMLNVDVYLQRLVATHGPEPGRHRLRLTINRCYSMRSMGMGGAMYPFCLIHCGLWEWRTRIMEGEGEFVFDETFDLTIGLPELERVELVVMNFYPAKSVEIGRTLVPLKNLHKARPTLCQLPIISQVGTQWAQIRGTADLILYTEDFGLSEETGNLGLDQLPTSTSAAQRAIADGPSSTSHVSSPTRPTSQITAEEGHNHNSNSNGGDHVVFGEGSRDDRQRSVWVSVVPERSPSQTQRPPFVLQNSPPLPSEVLAQPGGGNARWLSAILSESEPEERGASNSNNSGVGHTHNASRSSAGDGRGGGGTREGGPVVLDEHDVPGHSALHSANDSIVSLYNHHNNNNNDNEGSRYSNLASEAQNPSTGAAAAAAAATTTTTHESAGAHAQGVFSRVNVMILGFTDMVPLSDEVYLRVTNKAKAVLLRLPPFAPAKLAQLQGASFELSDVGKAMNEVFTLKLGRRRFLRSEALCYVDFSLALCRPRHVTEKRLRLYDLHCRFFGFCHLQVMIPDMSARSIPRHFHTTTTLELVMDDIFSVVGRYNPQDLRRVDILTARANHLSEAHRSLRLQLAPAVVATVYVAVHAVQLRPRTPGEGGGGGGGVLRGGRAHAANTSRDKNTLTTTAATSQTTAGAAVPNTSNSAIAATKTSLEASNSFCGSAMVSSHRSRNARTTLRPANVSQGSLAAANANAANNGSGSQAMLIASSTELAPSSSSAAAANTATAAAAQKLPMCISATVGHYHVEERYSSLRTAGDLSYGMQRDAMQSLVCPLLRVDIACTGKDAVMTLRVHERAAGSSNNNSNNSNNKSNNSGSKRNGNASETDGVQGEVTVSLRALLTPAVYDMSERITLPLVSVQKDANNVHVEHIGSIVFSLVPPLYEKYPSTLLLPRGATARFSRPFVRYYTDRLLRFLEYYDANSLGRLHVRIYEGCVAGGAWARTLPAYLEQLIERWGPEKGTPGPVPLLDEENDVRAGSGALYTTAAGPAAPSTTNTSKQTKSYRSAIDADDDDDDDENAAVEAAESPSGLVSILSVTPHTRAESIDLCSGESNVPPSSREAADNDK